jgi:hypothetical protein
MHTLPHPSVAQRCRVGTIRAVLRSAVPAGCAGYFAMISISRPARMRYTMRRRLTRKLRRPASSLLITLHRSRHPPDDDLVAAEIAAFDGFWQCQFPHTGLSCTQARDIGAPSADADSQLADTAALDVALIHLSLGPDEQVGTLMVGFNKRINVISESLTDVKDAPCRDFSPRWKNRKPWRQQSGGHPQHVENSWASDGRRSHIGLA